VCIGIVLRVQGCFQVFHVFFRVYGCVYASRKFQGFGFFVRGFEGVVMSSRLFSGIPFCFRVYGCVYFWILKVFGFRVF
jgi:hypothetical protein